MLKQKGIKQDLPKWKL